MKPEQIVGLLRYTDKKDGVPIPQPKDETMRKFGALASRFFNEVSSVNMPILTDANDSRENYRYHRFVIVERPGYQVLLDIGGAMIGQDINPGQITVRLWDKVGHILTRATFKRHSLDTERIAVDPDDEMEVADSDTDLMEILNSGATLDLEKTRSYEKPLYIDPEFVGRVTNAMDGAEINMQLCKEVLAYMENEPGSRYKNDF